MPGSGFLRFISDHAGRRRRTILVGGVVSGLLQGLTIAIIGMGLDAFSNDHSVSFRILLLFVLSVLSYYWSYRMAMAASTSVAFDAVSDIQLRISDKLRHMDAMAFARMEHSQIYATLMGNKDIVIEASRFLVSFISGAAMMFCAFIYAAFISLPGLLLILGIMVLCGFIFARMQGNIFTLQEKAQGTDEKFLASLKDLLAGFTELKMHRPKSDDLYENGIRKLCLKAIEAKRTAEETTIKCTAFYTSFTFFPVGAAIFFLPLYVNITTDQLIKLIAVTLFSLSPLMGLVLFIPIVAKAQMMLDSMQSFETLLDTEREPDPLQPPQAPDFQRIAIHEASFSYEAPNGQQPFTLELSDFSLSRGELVFLAGGNGSGKSTFMRILAGLMPLDSGTIEVDGAPLDQVGLHNYRALFSIIFTDFHLFDTLYGLDEPDPARVAALLQRMRLTDKVSLNGRRFSTTSLSSGQRKRLALICVMLEDRPVLLFDEVAADFDFQFRDFFYSVLLPELKAMGKTILAISHDDRYFHVADRVLFMRYGTFEPAPEPCPPGRTAKPSTPTRRKRS